MGQGGKGPSGEGEWARGNGPGGMGQGFSLPPFFCLSLFFYYFSFLFLVYLKCQSILPKLVHPTIIRLAILDNPRTFLVFVLKPFIFAFVLILNSNRFRTNASLSTVTEVTWQH